MALVMGALVRRVRRTFEECDCVVCGQTTPNATKQAEGPELANNHRSVCEQVPSRDDADHDRCLLRGDLHCGCQHSLQRVKRWRGDPGPLLLSPLRSAPYVAALRRLTAVD